MFDNLGTALVQAVGFFGVFGFFVYQLLSDDKKSTNTELKSSRKKINESKEVKEKTKKNGLFGRKVKPIKEEIKPKRKRIFGRKEEPTEVLAKPKNKGWF